MDANGNELRLHARYGQNGWAITSGRKNGLFLGSPRGGQVAATAFSLIQTCKALGINPEAYLKDVLTRLPTTLQKDLDSLLPHHWQPPAS